jgi:hypothetical protein
VKTNGVAHITIVIRQDGQLYLLDVNLLRLKNCLSRHMKNVYSFSLSSLWEGSWSKASWILWISSDDIERLLGQAIKIVGVTENRSIDIQNSEYRNNSKIKHLMISKRL